MKDFLLALSAIAPLFFPMAAGYLLKQINLLDEHTVKGMNKAVFRFFLPLLLCCNIYHSDLEQVFNKELTAFAVIAVLLSFLITLLDLLPIIGAGLFLLPWALLELLLGNTGRSIGLALLYAAIVAIRNLLEPHVLGKQIGLHPFVSLVSVYYGWRLAGFAGMLLVPCGVLILVKLQEWGYSKLWR